MPIYRSPAFLTGLAAMVLFQACSKPTDTLRTSTHDVIITGVADGHKIAAIKAVREVTGLGLKDAKDLVEGAPSVVKQALQKAEAETLATKLRASGLTIELKQR